MRCNLLEFVLIADRHTPLSINNPVNENSPNWFLYQLTMDRMKSLRDVSTHWRATCSYDKYGINNYKDYVRGKFAEADIFAFLGQAVCLKTELVNIRGHTGIHKTAKLWQVAGITLLISTVLQRVASLIPPLGQRVVRTTLVITAVQTPSLLVQ